MMRDKKSDEMGINLREFKHAIILITVRKHRYFDKIFSKFSEKEAKPLEILNVVMDEKK